MNHNDVSETELANTDKIRNAIANSPSVTRKELQWLTGCPEVDMIIEPGNDLCDEEYRQVATQEDFNS